MRARTAQFGEPVRGLTAQLPNTGRAQNTGRLRSPNSRGNETWGPHHAVSRAGEPAGGEHGRREWGGVALAPSRPRPRRNYNSSGPSQAASSVDADAATRLTWSLVSRSAPVTCFRRRCGEGQRVNGRGEPRRLGGGVVARYPRCCAHRPQGRRHAAESLAGDHHAAGWVQPRGLARGTEQRVEEGAAHRGRNGEGQEADLGRDTAGTTPHRYAA